MNVNEFDFLSKSGNIGFYNKCETIEIIGFDRKKEEAFNIFTLIIFEDTKQKNIEKFLTKGLQKFNKIKDMSWGIKKRIIDITESRNIYDDLLFNNKLILDSKVKINIGKLKFLSQQYVQPTTMLTKVQMNYIIKNNFQNGSYILEAFDEEKKNIQFLLDNPEVLNDFSEIISDLLPLKIGNLSDRLGNVIFQFPINLFKVKHNSLLSQSPKKYAGIKINIFPKNKNYQFDNLMIRIFEENDNLICRQKIVNVETEEIDILLDDCFGTYIEVIDKNNGLILYRDKFSIIKVFHINGGLISQQKRIFDLNGQLQKLEVTHSMNSSNEREEKYFNQWSNNRKYEEELKELEESKSFIQYFGNENEKALKDIRLLINKYGDNGVYLWDPYLSAVDIKNTLYFCQKSYVSLKAISGLKSKEQTKEEMKNYFEMDDKEFLFTNLEFRGKSSNFHDRFLIFPLEKTKVWSLGTSVNALGKSHHILQELKHGQHILNAFTQLWNELDDKKDLIWKNN